jgi:hypothetical protein
LNQTFGEQWIGCGAQSTGLHDHLTLILWIFGCRDTYRLWKNDHFREDVMGKAYRTHMGQKRDACRVLVGKPER